jgi:saccharopine dehydrogenase (NAD+, L-lysine-forming)
VATFAGRDALVATLGTQLDAVGGDRPTAIVIGALGRVGTGASDLCEAMGVTVTKWDMAQTASGGPFPEILDHELFINCILARPGTPVFVPKSALTQPRRLRVIGDVACDPDSDYNPVPVYDRATTWAKPALRVHDDPPLDVMAIDNLPSLLPRESSQDYARQLLPSLLTLDALDRGVWARAEDTYKTHMKEV